MSGSITVTLSGVPTEGASLDYTLPDGFYAHGQEWQVSDDGITWTNVGTEFQFTPRRHDHREVAARGSGRARQRS